MKKVLQIQYDTNDCLTQSYSIEVVANGTGLGSWLKERRPGVAPKHRERRETSQQRSLAL